MPLHSRPIPFRRAVDFLAVLPGALPGVFIGVRFVLAFNAPPLELGGSIWIIVLALGFWHLPQAYQATVAAWVKSTAASRTRPAIWERASFG